MSGIGIKSRNAMPATFVKHRVLLSGSVVFDLGHGRTITDCRAGREVQLNKEAANSPEAIETGLRYATTRFGLTLTVTGSADFQRRSVEIAVQKGLGVKFVDAKLDAYREHLERERRSPKTSVPIQLTKALTKEPNHGHELRHTIQRPRQVPPPHLRDRLHYLSESDALVPGLPNIALSELLAPITTQSSTPVTSQHIGRVIQIDDESVVQSGGAGAPVTYRRSAFDAKWKALLLESLHNRVVLRIDADKAGRPIAVSYARDPAEHAHTR
jgi:hypothetical protein